MPHSTEIDEAFRRLFKVFDQLRVMGAKSMGKSNLAMIVSLSYRQGQALSIIADGEKSTVGGIHQIELTRALHTTVPATSVLVDALVKKNLVRRFPCPNDRRSYCLRLTATGKKVLCVTQKSIRNLSKKLTDGLSQEDQDAFIRITDHFHRKFN